MYHAALQVCELYENALSSVRGCYFESDVYNVDPKAAAEFDKTFPPKEKVGGTPSQKRFDALVVQKREAPPTAAQFTQGQTFCFEAEIKSVPDMDGAYVAVPLDIKAISGKGRLKVHATFDGEPYDGSIVNMGVKNADGSICYIIGIRKDIRAKIGKQAGDMIKVTIKERT